MSEMIANHRGNLGLVGKIETIEDVYDLEFSLVGKIWDGRETVKSPTVWDFRDI